MLDVAFYDGAKRTIALAKAAGVYKGIYNMKNAVGREIPEEILKATGKEPFQGSFSKHLVAYQAATHTVAPVIDPSYSKVVDSIEDVLKNAASKMA